MRSVLLCCLLVLGSSTPILGQQLKEITNAIGMKLVLIHAGAFTMGSPELEVDRKEDETPHEVSMGNSYYIGAFEVTQGQYEKVMGENPTKLGPFKGDSSLYPVNSVKWDESVAFCRKLSELPNEKEVGHKYRLPTEAEWEYSCRATSTTEYCDGGTSLMYSANVSLAFFELLWVRWYFFIGRLPYRTISIVNIRSTFAWNGIDNDC